MVNGKSVGSCLGDLFSVSWMEDSDAVDITQETLNEQFDTVKTATSKSKVMQWGADAAFASADLDTAKGAMNARQVDLQQAYYNYVNAATGAERMAAGEELQSVISDQIAAETAYENFLHIVYPEDASKRQAARENKTPANQYKCEMAARKSFEENANFDVFSGFALQFQQQVVNVCADLEVSGANVDVAEAAKQACAGTTL